MYITINGKRRRVRRSIERFCYGFCEGIGWVIAIAVGVLFLWMFFAAASHYVLYH